MTAPRWACSHGRQSLATKEFNRLTFLETACCSVIDEQQPQPFSSREDRWDSPNLTDTQLRTLSVFKLYRAQSIERRMPTPGVVEPRNVVKDIRPGFAPRCVL